MARLLILVAVTAALLAGGCATKVVASGCRLFSVDEGAWVAANHEILREIPVYPGSSLVGQRSRGEPDLDSCFRWPESGGAPYESFSTELKHRPPARVSSADISDFYAQRLAETGWRLEWHDGSTRAYARGAESLWLKTGGSTWSLLANHDRR